VSCFVIYEVMGILGGISGRTKYHFMKNIDDIMTARYEGTIAKRKKLDTDIHIHTYIDFVQSLLVLGRVSFGSG